MIILGIETSCDDTGVAVLDVKRRKNPNFKILSNIVSSQVKLHAKYGGVYPALAKREHQKNLPIVLKKALKEAGNPKINLIAVTVGPGLEPCLWVGVNFAKELVKKLKKPLIPVDHMEGHIAANFIGGNSKLQITNHKKLFPAIALLVSGGHTQLILMSGIGKYKLIGETRDDAAGECFDKTARILGLGYPGGPAVAAAAAKFQITNSKFQIKLPRPMIYQKNYDFSFSGLKTAVLYRHRTQQPKVRKSAQYIQAMAAEIQQAIIDVLIHKTIKAAKEYKAEAIMLGGGVASNEELRKQFKLKIKKSKFKINFFAPKKILCTDNGAMIAAAGYFRWLRGIKVKPENIEADANLRLAP